MALTIAVVRPRLDYAHEDSIIGKVAKRLHVAAAWQDSSIPKVWNQLSSKQKSAFVAMALCADDLYKGSPDFTVETWEE